MSFSVYADGELLYVTGADADSSHTILSPELTQEINTAGEFDFIIPKRNDLYNDIKLRLTTIEIYHDDDIIWRGRPIHVSIGFSGNMQTICEGSLAYLNDTVYPADSNTMRLSKFLQKVIANHNEQCDSNRQIHVGLFTMEDVDIEYNGADTPSMEVLKDLVETYGGYIIPHESEGGSYFDWVKSVPEDTSKDIDITDVIDITKDIDAESITTCVIPIGKDDLRLGCKYIENPAAVTLFGKCWQAVTFSDIEDEDALYVAAETWLSENIWSSLQLDITAAQVGSGYEVGRSYMARISSFGINHVLALTSRSMTLDNVANTAYTFSASTIWTQINNGRDIADVMDATQKIKSATAKSLTAKTAVIESKVSGDTGFSGTVEFSDGTNLNFTKGICTGGKSSEGEF